MTHRPDGPPRRAVSGASAHVAGQLLTDLGVGGRRYPLEEVVRCHDQPRRAEPALHRARIDERLLHIARCVDRGHTLDGHDRLIDDGRCHHQARAHEHVVDEHAARTALALFARSLDAEQPESIAQHVEQALAEPRVGDVASQAVDVQRVVVAVAAHAATSELDARRTSRRASTPTA
jgi:hypothetical protein